ncbi:MAG: hypothetical protein NkDv07_0757 [Candidatus Improbicoccus devescovinae]|nr:MAG: hypothetical protein NkDv07_0757 [Candidatus Improbicoccus devescovinae]
MLVMNIFLKNNKIISRILCFLMITTPAAASRLAASLVHNESDDIIQEWVEAIDPANIPELEAKLEALRRKFIEAKYKRGRTDILVAIMLAVEELQQSYQYDYDSKMKIAKRTGVFSPPDRHYIFICREYMMKYLCLIPPAYETQIKKLRLLQATPEEKRAVIRMMPKVYRHWLEARQWTARTLPGSFIHLAQTLAQEETAPDDPGNPEAIPEDVIPYPLAHYEFPPEPSPPPVVTADRNHADPGSIWRAIDENPPYIRVFTRPGDDPAHNPDAYWEISTYEAMLPDANPIIGSDGNFYVERGR